MSSSAQNARATCLRRLHHAAGPLVLPNAWDAASARIIAQAGCQAIARITQVVECPVTAVSRQGTGRRLTPCLRRSAP